MAREALKALSKVRMSYNDLPAFYDYIEKEETPRMAAIVMASGIEDALEAVILENAMPGLSNTEKSALFDNDGQLASFGAKIRMGRALRLFGPLAHADLTCIREIRNAFAHAKIKLDFTHPAVIEACGHLQFPTGEEKSADARSRFFRAAEKLHSDLLGIINPSTPRTPEIP